jgi:hypothetical protein
MVAKQAALQRILGVDAPTAQQLMVQLEKEKQVGTIDPTLQGALTQGPSSYGNITVDPQLRAAQTIELAQLQQLGSTGLTASDRAALMQIQQQTSGQAQALNQSALANAASRGMAGGGAEMAARLMGGQGAANQGAQAGLNVAAQAQQKAIQAIASGGALGGQMEAQQYGEDVQKAASSDAISRFNVANRQNVYSQNVEQQNKAKYYNLGSAQDIANRNVAIANQQALQHSSAIQQAYEDALGKAKAASGQSNEVANQFGTQASNTSDMYSGLGGAAGGMLTAYANRPAGPDLSGQVNPGETAVDLGDESQFKPGKNNPLNGPALQNGNYSNDPFNQ